MACPCTCPRLPTCYSPAMFDVTAQSLSHLKPGARAWRVSSTQWRTMSSQAKQAAKAAWHSYIQFLRLWICTSPGSSISGYAEAIGKNSMILSSTLQAYLTCAPVMSHQHVVKCFNRCMACPPMLRNIAWVPPPGRSAPLPDLGGLMLAGP